jgi:hypothetical protein
MVILAKFKVFKGACDTRKWGINAQLKQRRYNSTEAEVHFQAALPLSSRLAHQANPNQNQNTTTI